MRVEMVQIARGYGIGDPPLRLADRALLYPTGVVVAVGAARTIVFDDEATFLHALRRIEDKSTVDFQTWTTWQRSTRDEKSIPCLRCRSLRPESEAHACGPRKANATALAVPASKLRARSRVAAYEETVETDRAATELRLERQTEERARIVREEERKREALEDAGAREADIETGDLDEAEIEAREAK